MNSRELFEAWIKLQKVSYGLSRFHDAPFESADYTDHNTRIMFASWEARGGDLNKQAF